MLIPRCWACAICPLLAFALAVQPSTATAATPEEIDASVVKAVEYVYGQQNADGLWESNSTRPTEEVIVKDHFKVTGGQWGGSTAVAVYALLSAGESVSDPRLVKAIKFLQSANIAGVYALGIRSQLFPFLPPSKDVRKEAAADVDRYVDSISTKGHSAGMFEYLLEPKSIKRLDHSVSQYGVLGAWACEKAGAEVPSSFWKNVEDGWIRDQKADGSWCYSNDTFNESFRQTRASMVAAGVATLFITQDYIHATNGILCTGNVVNPHIEAGLKWLGDNFGRVLDDPNSEKWSPHFGLYGIQRVGVASGRKYIGTTDWFDRGADYLVKHQEPSAGKWKGGLSETCVAILFLSRGRAPVAFNKLQYDVAGKEGNWNERPRDIANLTHWISKETERDLNWQIIDLHAPVRELLDAPVLYISGNKPLQFTRDEEAKLKDYCESGGLIMGHADCGNAAFAESFRRLGTKLFPAYEFRQLPTAHPIYTSEQYARTTWKTPPTILSLGNGIREMMILESLNDPGRHWQTQEVGRNVADFQLADDVLLYAIDKKNLLEKGKTFIVEPDAGAKTSKVIKLARLQYNGNWDPEPGGWRRLAAILHNNLQIDLQISSIKLGSNQLGDSKNNGPRIATLTGTAALKLDLVSRQEIKNFIEGGGTLIVDAAGGSADFAVSAESELVTIFGGDAAAALKISLPLSATVFNLPGKKITDFHYRPFAKNVVGSMHDPLLSAITFNKRPAVYFSRLDLSGGLVGSLTDGIIGYDPATATAIMTNLVVSAGLAATP